MSTEPKMYACGFKMDRRICATHNVPFLDVELTFGNYDVLLISKTPKTYAEFKEIFDKFNNEDKEKFELDQILNKKIMELEEKWGCDD